MVKDAVGDNPLFKVSDFEIKSPGRSYSITTVRHFCRILPVSTQLFFIIGGDSFPQLKTWKNIEDMLKMVTFIVVNRPGYSPRKNSIKHAAVTMPGIDISSSYLRRRVALGKSIKYLVPESVLEYIKKNKLYRT